MRLLLTSAGVTNKTIANSLLSLVGKPFNKTKITYVPTAANVEEGDKWWLMEDMANFQKLKPAQFDIVDFSAVPRDIWEKRLKQADILVFGGGNTFHLMYWINKSGLGKLLPELLKTRVYVGVSAGSMITTHSLFLSQSERLYSEDIGKIELNYGLSFVKFHIRPHFNSKWFPKVRIKYLQELSREIPDPIYALDDNSAVVADGDKITVVSEGEWKRFN